MKVDNGGQLLMEAEIMTPIVTLESISNNHHTKLFCMVVFNCTSSSAKVVDASIIHHQREIVMRFLHMLILFFTYLPVMNGKNFYDNKFEKKKKQETNVSN